MPNVSLTFTLYILFPQTRLWKPGHGYVTFTFITEEMELEAGQESVGSSPTIGLVTVGSVA